VDRKAAQLELSVTPGWVDSVDHAPSTPMAVPAYAADLAFIVKFVWWLVAAIGFIVLAGVVRGLAARPPARQSAITKQLPRFTRA
jgi:hypothetical protein